MPDKEISREQTLDWLNYRRVQAKGYLVGAMSDEERSEAADRIFAALQHLTDKEKEAFLLVVGQGLKQRQAAELLGISVKAVERRIQRSKAKLNLGIDAWMSLREDMVSEGIRVGRPKHLELTREEQKFVASLALVWKDKGVSENEIARMWGLSARSLRRYLALVS